MDSYESWPYSMAENSDCSNSEDDMQAIEEELYQQIYYTPLELPNTAAGTTVTSTSPTSCVVSSDKRNNFSAGQAPTNADQETSGKILPLSTKSNGIKKTIVHENNDKKIVSSPENLQIAMTKNGLRSKSPHNSKLLASLGFCEKSNNSTSKESSTRKKNRKESKQKKSKEKKKAENKLWSLMQKSHGDMDSEIARNMQMLVDSDSDDSVMVISSDDEVANDKPVVTLISSSDDDSDSSDSSLPYRIDKTATIPIDSSLFSINTSDDSVQNNARTSKSAYNPYATAFAEGNDVEVKSLFVIDVPKKDSIYYNILTSSLGPDDAMQESLNKLPDTGWDIIPADMYNFNTSDRFKRRTCQFCDKIGHQVFDCPSRPCIYCGEVGHRHFRCPQRYCINCLVPGHYFSGCRSKRVNRHYLICKRCQMPGHRREECSDNWRQFHITTERGPLEETEQLENKNMCCYNCGGKGHFGFECSKYHQNVMRFCPIVSSYDSYEDPYDPALLQRHEKMDTAFRKAVERYPGDAPELDVTETSATKENKKLNKSTIVESKKLKKGKLKENKKLKKRKPQESKKHKKFINASSIEDAECAPKKKKARKDSFTKKSNKHRRLSDGHVNKHKSPARQEKKINKTPPAKDRKVSRGKKKVSLTKSPQIAVKGKTKKKQKHKMNKSIY